MVEAICSLVVMAWSVYAGPAVAVGTCHDVLTVAERAGLDLPLVAAIAYTESRFRADAESRAGAVGPLQVLPKYHCPNRRRAGCDLVAAGVGAIIRHLDVYGRKGLAAVLCHWNAGNACGEKGRLFAKIVIKRQAKIRRMVRDHRRSPASMLAHAP